MELDRLEICDVLDRYFHGLDSRDLSLIESCFSGTAKVNLHENSDHARSIIGAHTIALNLCERAKGRAATTHLPANRAIRISGDTAHADTFAIAHIFKSGRVGEPILVRGLRYQDELARVGGVWLIDARRHQCLWQYEVTSTQPRSPG